MFVLILLSVVNIYAGKRKNFFSHGPSVSSFAQGETVLNNLNEPSIIFYNGSLMSFFDYNSVGLARYNLFEGSSYNSAAANIKLFNNFNAIFAIFNFTSTVYSFKCLLFNIS